MQRQSLKIVTVVILMDLTALTHFVQICIIYGEFGPWKIILSTYSGDRQIEIGGVMQHCLLKSTQALCQGLTNDGWPTSSPPDMLQIKRKYSLGFKLKSVCNYLQQNYRVPILNCIKVMLKLLDILNSQMSCNFLALYSPMMHPHVQIHFFMRISQCSLFATYPAPLTLM